MTETDPRPTPPEEPSHEQCCGRGCVPCIYDLYEEALTRYEVALRAWQERRDQEAAGPRVTMSP